MAALTAVVEHGAQRLAEALLTASVQGALLVVVVWLVCWGVRSIPASIRALLWWLASLKLLLALALPPIPVPVLPAAARDATWICGASRVPSNEGARALPAPSAVRVPVPVEPPRAAVSSRWTLAAIGIWLLGVAACAVRLLAGMRKVRGVLARSVPVGDEDAALARRLSADVGLTRLPDVRVSDEVDAPQVVGVRRPVVLLPCSVAATFAPDERAMALCHELMHVRRRDLLLGWVPACAERLLFFHPLARLAAREYVLAREAACDAAVVRALGAAPQEYGRVLLRLGITGADPGLSAAASSRSASSLRRRLDMLHHIARPGRAAWLIAGIAALALLPWQLVARTADVPPAHSDPLATAASGSASSDAGPQTQSHGLEPAERDARSAVDGSQGLDELLRPWNRVEAGAAELRGSNVTIDALSIETDASGHVAKVEGQVTFERDAEQAAAGESRRAEPAVDEQLQRIVAEAQRLLKGARGGQPADQALLESMTQAAAIGQIGQVDQPAAQELDDLSAKLRELERALRQKEIMDLDQPAREIQKAEEEIGYSRQRPLEAVEAVRQLMEAARAQREAAREIDQQARLTRQAEQLRRMQESIVQQMQRLLEQQEALKEMQRMLEAEADRIREAIERALQTQGLQFRTGRTF